MFFEGMPMVMRRALLKGAVGLATAALLNAMPAHAQEQQLTVFAAASLTDALQAAGKAFTARTKIPVRFSFASSAVLARQLEAGAPADMFLSADREWMDHVEQRGLIRRGSRTDLLGGRLVLVAPVGSRVRLPIRRGFAIDAALRGGRLAIADPDYVPAGRYARAALTSLGVWPRVEARLARGENVRSTLALVARAETPLGIVYATDARLEPRVRILGLFPEASHPPIVYPVAVMAKGSARAVQFHAFLRSASASTIFRRFGFIPLQAGAKAR